MQTQVSLELSIPLPQPHHAEMRGSNLYTKFFYGNGISLGLAGLELIETHLSLLELKA